MMANSPKIMAYFVKKEQVEGTTRDVKMTQEIAIKHERNAEDKTTLEIEAENGEYYEDYKEQKPADLKMESELRAASEVATDSDRDVEVNTGTAFNYEVNTEDMTTPENETENEEQSEEHREPRPAVGGAGGGEGGGGGAGGGGAGGGCGRDGGGGTTPHLARGEARRGQGHSCGSGQRSVPARKHRSPAASSELGAHWDKLC